MTSYRQAEISFLPPLTPVVKTLLIAIGVVYVQTYIPEHYFGFDPINYMYWFGLTAEFVLHKFFLWQLVTYLFLHEGWFHFGFNLFALWMFGVDLERLWGGKRFAIFFLVTGVGAGLFDVALSAIFRPDLLQTTVGCSGAIFGILLAFAMTFPDRLIYFWGVIPIKAKWFVAGLGAIAFVSSFEPNSNVSHFAHLGGLLTGFLFLRGGKIPARWQLSYSQWRRAQTRKKFEVYMRDQEKKDKHGRWVN